MSHRDDMSLRARADALAQKLVVGPTEVAAGEIEGVLHELQVHQIELEIQNDELRRTQHALEEAHAKYFALYDRAPVGYLTVSASGEILEANAAAVTLLGLTNRQPINEPMTRLIVGEDQDIYYLFRRRLAERPGAQTCELRMLRPGAAPIWVRIEGVVAETARGRYWLALADVTARKELETAHDESQARLASIVDSALDGIVTVDEDEHIVVFNRGAEKMFGCPAAHAVGTHVERFIPERYRAAHHEHLRRFRESGVGGARAAHGITGLRCGGEEFPIEAAISRSQSQGRVLSTIVLRDVTERVRLEKARGELELRLHRAQKLEALGTLAGGIAHDFNNILGTIVGNVELARQDVGPDHPAIESLAEIGKASHRAQDLVARILTFGTRQERPQGVFALAPLVADAVALLRPTLPAGIVLSMTAAADIPPVRAEPTLIQQMLINLCTNARHAIQGAGRITVQLDAAVIGEDACAIDQPLPPGRFARLRVTDDGCGMDATTRARLFEPFFSTKPQGEGTGLGLSVVHGIVRVHDGGITVDSDLGKGTTFTIYLPAATTPVPDSARTPVRAAPSPISAAAHLHVLYVDDEEPLVFLMRRLLERRGYRVSGYTDPEEALAALRADPQQFDLVVADLSMPKRSGLEVAAEVARLRRDLPVVLVSGYVTAQLRAAASAIGVRHVVHKPDTVEGLCAAVESLIGAPRIP